MPLTNLDKQKICSHVLKCTAELVGGQSIELYGVKIDCHPISAQPRYSVNGERCSLNVILEIIYDQFKNGGPF